MQLIEAAFGAIEAIIAFGFAYWAFHYDIASVLVSIPVFILPLVRNDNILFPVFSFLLVDKHSVQIRETAIQAFALSTRVSLFAYRTGMQADEAL